MNKIFLFTAVLIATVIPPQVHAQTNWANKPVQCLSSVDFVTNVRATGYEPLVGGLAVATMADLTSTFEAAVIYWTLPESDRWLISESDQDGTTCVLANGDNNNFDTDQINSVLDKMADK